MKRQSDKRIMSWHTRAVLGASFLLVLSTASSPAFAYLDPGTATMVFSAIAAGIAAGMVYLKVGWSKIIGLFGRAGRKKAS